MKGHPRGQRTAVVFAGSGAAGAYHAGVLKALDAAGVRIDLMVGSGVGVLAAAFGAAASGPMLYGDDGLWRKVSSRDVFRLRPGLRALRALGLVALFAFLVPALLTLLFGLLLPLFLAVDLARPGFMAEVLRAVAALAPGLRLFFVFALAAPTFFGLLFLLFRGVAVLRVSGRRAGEALESAIDLSGIEADVARRLFEAARGPASGGAGPDLQEAGRLVAGLVAENRGQPGFRGLVLRAVDLDGEEPLVVKVGADDPNGLPGGGPEAIDMGDPAAAFLLGEVTGTAFRVLPHAAPRRVRLPKQGAHGGEVRRIAEATLAGGAGIAEAISFGADRVIVVTAVAEEEGRPSERRGLRALAGAVLALQERRAIEAEIAHTERLNRIIETVGHQRSTGQREWQDPLTGRRYRPVTLHVVRPRRPLLRPLDLDGAVDPANEVETAVADWMDEGERDAHRCFLEEALGADPADAVVAEVS